MDNILDCVHLTKVYSGVRALDNVTVSFPAGKIIGLLGPNGSGKTTLIKLIAGLLVPTAGNLYVDGKAPGEETKAVVSYLPERPYFDPSMRISEMLQFFADFYSDFDIERAKKAKEKAETRLEKAKRSDYEYKLAEIKLKKSLARLKVSGKKD